MRQSVSTPLDVIDAMLSDKQKCFLLGLLLPIFFPSWLILNGLLDANNPAQAAESLSRTESNCTVGMAKGDVNAECQVPIPAGCTVAQFPGYPEPWADISKGGGTSCEFDEKVTDWKTSIVGTCHNCKTEHCTGRFIVMFNCAGNIPPANPASPQRK